MKKLLILFIVLVSGNLHSQDLQYPRYFIQNEDTLGIVFSIDQAQKIYNNQLLNDLYSGYKLNCDSVKNRLKVIVNKYERMQIVDNTIIEQQDRSLKDKDNTIEMFRNKEKNFDKDLYKCDLENKIREEKISNLNKIVKDLEWQKKWLIGSSVGLGAATLFLLGVISTK